MADQRILLRATPVVIPAAHTRLYFAAWRLCGLFVIDRKTFYLPIIW